MMMCQLESTASPSKRLSYRQAQAAKILTAERMGRSPSCVEYAGEIMKGFTVSPMHMAAVEREATRFHEDVRVDEALMRDANEVLMSVLAEFGFV